MKKVLRSTLVKLSLISLGFSFFGCYYDEPEEIDSSTIVSFTTDIQPIFNASCISCHPLIQAVPDLTEGNSYNSIVTNEMIKANDLEASVLYQRLIGNPTIMPSSGSLPSTEINLVKIWIEQGALNN
ncbi:hypothetical protein [Maribacter sp. HTCC2170]|uniref:hypothetical protein n=1 Tax=Maribacter sp. (strain HTCC2170 / KCCM 42371) TaxID=313603 RepID=UPI00006B2268|nr:hypothetical protein [Maribacter sp. HTCC2170]EAR00261.1 hypothetical protein FB2170_12606 [Maribacter sp. HTCC2170]